MLQDDYKVMITSNAKGSVRLMEPGSFLNVYFEKKGAKKSVAFGKLKEAIYNTGVERLFTEGYLIIEDMAVKKELGLEPEDAVAPVNIIILTDEQKKNLLVNKPIFDFKAKLEEMNDNQVSELAEFAIDNELMLSMDKVDYVRERVGIDIINGIRNARLINEK